MAENEGGNENGQGGQESGAEFTPITSQEELNKILGERIARERAKFSDYADLKKKAAEFDKVAEASKTEAQKTAERIADLEKQLQSTQTAAVRARIQARFSIADEDADLFLTATDEDTLIKQAERLAERESDRKKQGNRAPLQGRTPNQSGSDDMREFARGLFGRE